MSSETKRWTYPCGSLISETSHRHGEGLGEPAGRVGPPAPGREPGGGQLPVYAGPAELRRDLGPQLLAGREVHDEVERVDVYAHRPLGAQPHLDPLLLRVPERDVREGVRL